MVSRVDDMQQRKKNVDDEGEVQALEAVKITQ